MSNIGALSYDLIRLGRELRTVENDVRKRNKNRTQQAEQHVTETAIRIVEWVVSDTMKVPTHMQRNYTDATETATDVAREIGNAIDHAIAMTVDEHKAEFNALLKAIYSAMDRGRDLATLAADAINPDSLLIERIAE